MSFVYEETAGLYSRKYGRPPIDPVVLVKYLLVGFLYGIPSERQIEQRIQTDVALRWYLGIDLLERVPIKHNQPAAAAEAVVSKIFRRLFEGGKSMYCGRNGKWRAGIDGFHPRQSQRLPGVRGADRHAGEPWSILGTAGFL